MDVQVGVDASSNSRIEMELSDLESHHIGLTTLDVSTAAGGQAAITRIDQLMGRLNTDRARLGALHNRLDNAIANAESSHLNLSGESDSRRGHGGGSQMTALQVKQQAGVAAMSRSQTSSSSVINLI